MPRLNEHIRIMLLRFAENIMRKRPPDFIVGANTDPYLHRWRIFPRNSIANIYIHKFWRDDDDRALHDHPYNNLSVVLENGYYEQLSYARSFRPEGWVGYRRAEQAHRVILCVPNIPAVTIFIHGPRIREWGFYCSKGWIPWQQFSGQTDPDKSGDPRHSRGCE